LESLPSRKEKDRAVLRRVSLSLRRGARQQKESWKGGGTVVRSVVVADESCQMQKKKKGRGDDRGGKRGALPPGDQQEARERSDSRRGALLKKKAPSFKVKERQRCGGFWGVFLLGGGGLGFFWVFGVGVGEGACLPVSAHRRNAVFVEEGNPWQ